MDKREQMQHLAELKASIEKKSISEVYQAFSDYVSGKIEWSELETYAEDITGILGGMLK